MNLLPRGPLVPLELLHPCAHSPDEAPISEGVRVKQQGGAAQGNPKCLSVALCLEHYHHANGSLLPRPPQEKANASVATHVFSDRRTLPSPEWKQ